MTSDAATGDLSLWNEKKNTHHVIVYMFLAGALRLLKGVRILGAG